MECIKTPLLSNHSCISLLQNSLPWLIHSFFGLQLDSFTILRKSSRTVSPYLFFKGLIQAYLVKTSILHNKYSTFFYDIFFISNNSAAQILPLNAKYTFLLLNFLITGLCNSSTSYVFTLIPDPVFLSKNL